MMRALFIILLLPILAAAEDLSVTTPAPTSKQESATNRTVNIAIGNFTFVPAALTVAAGTKLVWVNQDDVPHIVIGTDAESPIKSQPLDTDDRYSVTITQPGTYKYFCTLHPHMVGTVVVQ
jgi:plastocyanin